MLLRITGIKMNTEIERSFELAFYDYFAPCVMVFADVSLTNPATLKCTVAF